jgi:DNA primase
LFKVYRVNGNHYTCFCPFHNDLNASLSIDLDKLCSYCFAGCKEVRGSLVKVVANTFHVPWVTAIKMINSLEIFDFSQQESPIIKPSPLTSCDDHVEWKPIFGEGLRYLKDRGFKISTLKYWDLEYSPLIRHIRFPIYAKDGNLISYSFRTIDKIDPPYLHPGLSKKTGTLYGENCIDDEVKSIYITEGALDAMWLWQWGFYNALAVLGSPSLQQIKRVASLGNHFNICFDGDEAGRKYTELMVEELEKRRMNYRIIELPEGKDVQDLTRDELIEVMRRKK